ncbi:hypothetical protein V5799_006302 [Amblyomma americanum]|uniref:Uncharacterized protein n=1 Tax=Amblyomma americanum TaxID=6943 RepID=A0AAQ4DWS8_AMBAM
MNNCAPVVAPAAPCHAFSHRRTRRGFAEVSITEIQNIFLSDISLTRTVCGYNQKYLKHFQHFRNCPSHDPFSIENYASRHPSVPTYEQPAI